MRPCRHLLALADKGWASGVHGMIEHLAWMGLNVPRRQADLFRGRQSPWAGCNLTATGAEAVNEKARQTAGLHVFGANAQAFAFNASRISARSSSVVGPAGSSGVASSSFAAASFTLFT